MTIRGIHLQVPVHFHDVVHVFFTLRVSGLTGASHNPNDALASKLGYVPLVLVTVYPTEREGTRMRNTKEIRIVKKEGGKRKRNDDLLDKRNKGVKSLSAPYSHHMSVICYHSTVISNYCCVDSSVLAIRTGNDFEAKGLNIGMIFSLEHFHQCCPQLQFGFGSLVRIPSRGRRVFNLQNQRNKEIEI
jgi:hypothetical protein